MQGLSIKIQKLSDQMYRAWKKEELDEYGLVANDYF
jgi:hypothetical protein